MRQRSLGIAREYWPSSCTFRYRGRLWPAGVISHSRIIADESEPRKMSCSSAIDHGVSIVSFDFKNSSFGTR